MADQFQAGSCSTSGMIWWTTAPAAPAPDTLEPRSRLSCGESPVSLSSTSSVTFQDYIHDSGLLLDSAHPHPVDLGLSTSTAVEWPHAFLSGIESGQINMEMEIMNRSSFLQEPLLSAAAASTFGLPLHSQIIEDARSERSSFDVSQMNSSLNSSSTAQSPLKQQQQLQFSNETPFWNPTMENSSFHHIRPPQPFPNQNPSYSNPILKTTQGVGSSCTAMEIKRNDSIEQVLVKKPRIETPSSLPTFKVRKEKLGDRITALQQLVSPFGKTDTASVLHEAIEYIKFLHDQVRVLSAPYLKGSHQPQQMKALDKSISKDSDQAQSEDLRSRGLCLVPISSTFAVANETDFWTPSFIGGTFR